MPLSNVLNPIIEIRLEEILTFPPFVYTRLNIFLRIVWLKINKREECRFVDSENILGLLLKNHYEIVNDKNKADILIINTCGFIESSKKESIDTILDNINKKQKVVVTGCLVNRYVDELKKSIPEVDLWIPIRDYPRFNQLLATLDKNITNYEGLNDDYRLVSTGSYSAYLKIGEGCSNCCTYCAIPLIRGPYVSRPYEDIIKEARKLASEGYKELIVLEQDTTRYGLDLKEIYSKDS